MSIWIFKATIQKCISFLPFKHHINYLFQKFITRGVNLTDAYFLDKIGHAQNHVTFFKEFVNIPNFKVYELGSGWYPVIPLYFFFSGSNEIYSVDIAQHISKKNFKITLEKYFEALKKPDMTHVFESFIQERIEIAESVLSFWEDLSFEEIKKQFRLRLLLMDARNTDFENNSFDLITSNNTFEHIPFPVLGEILHEMKRVLNNKGIMSHFIDMSDHFAHLDNSITIYNFLKFSERKWKYIDNSIQPQNRKRLIHYKELLKEKNLEIIHEENRTGSPEEIMKLNLAEPFKQLGAEENAISHSHLVLRNRDA